MVSVLLLGDWIDSGITITDKIDREADVIRRAMAGDERIVLDLHASGDYQTAGRWLSMKDSIKLQPGECVRIRTREQIHFPKGVVGLILSRVSLAADGLIVATVKVDPQFLGRPEIAVTNGSQRAIELTDGLAFASIMAVKLANPMTEDLPRIVTPTKSLEAPRWRQRFRRAAPFFATGVLTLLAASGPELAKVILGVS